MNRTSPHLPAEVHTDRRLSAETRKPRLGDTSADRPAAPCPPRRFGNLRTGLICLALVAGLCAALIPALRVAYQAMNGSLSADGLGQALGQGLLQGGLPPTGGLPQAGELVGGTAEDTDGTALDPETDPRDPDTEEATPSESDTEDLREPMTDSAETEPAATLPDGENTEPESTDSGTGSTAEPETESESEPGTAEPVPDGCYPIISVDVSQADRGAGYLVGEMAEIPDTLPKGGLWSTVGTPTVLIVNTHPYEGYSDGTAWYDPSAGGLAQTDTPSAADGTVALGADLARALRGMGVTVIHLRIAVSAEDSAADIYDRTETVVRSYCRLYPDIGLVLDLRRSAELTEDGGILRTAGSLDGEACAQVRISVSGGREEAALGRDLTAALTLREGLWGVEPTVSRPVRVKAGSGLAGDLTDVCVLTLEMGSAGNTYPEAARLALPVAAVLSGMVLDQN